MARRMSDRQIERQQSEHRSRGRYAKVNPCGACGKSAGVDYWSDHRVDVLPGYHIALCLCVKCAKKGEAMDDVAALAWYEEQAAKLAAAKES